MFDNDETMGLPKYKYFQTYQKIHEMHSHTHTPKELLSSKNTLKEASHFTIKNKVFFPRERQRERERREGDNSYFLVLHLPRF